MTGMLEWLLGLDRIRLTHGAPLSFRFATPPAPWIMLVGAVLAAAAIFAIYRKEKTPKQWRWVLSLLRFGTVMTVLFLIGQPMLVLRRNHVDPSRVVVLLDRSMSMATRDGTAGSHTDSAALTAARASRWNEAVDALTNPAASLLAELAAHHRVSIWPFAESASPEIEVAARDDLPEVRKVLSRMAPDGAQTDLSGAVAKALEQTQGSPVAAAIVISDGRQTRGQQVDAALSQALARSVPIHVLATGSEKPPPDLAVDSALCEEDVFVRDRVTVHVQVSGKGYEEAVGVEAQLRDQATGELLATKAIRVSEDRPTTVDLSFRPTRTGPRVLTVSVPPGDEEENIANNRAEVDINAHDEKIHVLYVEGSPRFEYRYLKNMLLREPSIESSCLLLSATPGFTQEGTRPIRRFPQSIEELRPYDVIILGDVDPRGDWLSPVQQTLLCDAVMIQGAGAAFVAGETHMPHRLRQTALEKLLPVRVDPEFRGRYDQALPDAFEPRLTIEGRLSPLFQSEVEDSSGDDGPTGRAGWYWFARVLGAQPAATVLLTHPTAMCDGQAMPLVVLGRVGAGRTMFLGSDDLWRWRQTAGEAAYESFWLRTIRLLARGRHLGGDCRWRFTTDRRRYELGQSVRVRLTAEEGQAGDTSQVPVGVSDPVRGWVDRIMLKPTGAGPNELEGEYTPRSTGRFTLIPTLADGSGGCKRLGAAITVSATDSERLHVEADHEFLRMLASRTGGRFSTSPGDIPALAAAIPDRSVQIADDLEEPLWDKKIIIVLFGVLIVGEWILRKALGLT